MQGDTLGIGPGAAMDAALARLNRAEEDVAALREAIKVDSGHVLELVLVCASVPLRSSLHGPSQSPVSDACIWC